MCCICPMAILLKVSLIAVCPPLEKRIADEDKDLDHAQPKCLLLPSKTLLLVTPKHFCCSSARCLPSGSQGNAVLTCDARYPGRAHACTQAHVVKSIMQMVSREIRMLSSLTHPNLVKLLSTFQSRSGRVHMVRAAPTQCMHAVAP
jgi:hypothetical protein